MRSLNYKDIINYLDENCEFYNLLTTEDDFSLEKEKQQKSPLYVKLHFKCSNCGEEFYRSLACVKASVDGGRCRKCGLWAGKEKIMKYSKKELVLQLESKGIKNIKFLDENYCGVSSRIEFEAVCGHKTKSIAEAILKQKYCVCGKCAPHLHEGENAYNWKGGYENERTKFRKTYEFKQFVKDVLKRDSFTCQKCKRNSNEIPLIVHHKDGYAWCVEKRTQIENGVCLCEDCHKKFHNIYGVGKNTAAQFNEFMLSE